MSVEQTRRTAAMERELDATEQLARERAAIAVQARCGNADRPPCPCAASARRGSPARLFAGWTPPWGCQGIFLHGGRYASHQCCSLDAHIPVRVHKRGGLTV